RADQNAFSERSAVLARVDQAIPRRRAYAALRQTGGDRRAGAVHLFRRLRIHGRGYGLCERRWWMALIGYVSLSQNLLDELHGSQAISKRPLKDCAPVVAASATAYPRRRRGEAAG